MTSAARAEAGRRSLSVLDDFLSACQSRSLVVVFVNSPYLPVFERWLTCFRAHCATNLLVVALDEQAHEEVVRRGVSSIHVPLDDFAEFLSIKRYSPREVANLQALWHLRLLVFQRIIEKGIELVHSDADALWIRNPLPVLASLRHDFIASVGLGHPQAITKEWGFAICMGFFILRSTPAAKQLLRRLLHLMEEKHPDDQTALNFLVKELGVRWTRTPDGAHESRIEDLDLTIRTVSWDLVSRRPRKGVLVYHPFLKGGIQEKIRTLDTGWHELMALSGLEQSYARRNPVPKTRTSRWPFVKVNRVRGVPLPHLTRRVLFIHVPKAGGTSTQQALALRGRGHMRIMDVERRHRYFSFSVVRNPYSRLVSAFQYLTCRETLPVWDHEESDYVYRYRGDFKRFVREVVALLDIYRSIHLLPQTFFLCDGDSVVVDRLIALEDLDRDLAPISRRVGGARRLSRSNASQRDDIETYYDAETRAIVARVYEKDFRLLGYDPCGGLEAPPALDPPH
jgi:chondroitin 4-sulfotransferase 11